MNQTGLKIAVKIYDAAWGGIIPALRLSSRLKDGYAGRCLAADPPAADLWIQAASGGEAYLAWSLLSTLKPRQPVRALVTTNTRQGMDILEKAAADIDSSGSAITLIPGWFPFDRPSLTEKAVRKINPKLVVLLETEIWPGLLYALKVSNVPAWIINGRITEKSFSLYRRGRNLLSMLRPEGVLAVSAADAAWFARLFGENIVFEMPNMKFDRLSTTGSSDQGRSLSLILGSEAKFLVLGSIRKQEEKRIKKLIRQVHSYHPDIITGLFPRHMHRLDYWKRELTRMGLAWTLRSDLKPPAKAGSVILWDKFGELSEAYWEADAVFVGGSIAPLGGQNFLEPLICGCRPVIGPYWENFYWVGETIFHHGLVLKENNWQSAAQRLIEQLHKPEDKKEIREKAIGYIQARQGGTKKACQIIEKRLSGAYAKEA
ncbi:MAG: 3-deoxy-D-manno-octulosonic acid transferase [Desulfobacteraceae bacterium]|nr:3-deoxy-D-manno-octulosonic acid transferase [Desulfobacteraceae bacterium]